MRAPLGLILVLLAATTVVAAPNQTPGKYGRCKTFGAFSPNLWEFGAPEIAIFQSIVVNSQHYKQGPIYLDRDNDGNPDGAGLMNFLAFCENRDADVMFLSTHGRATATTLVEKYPRGGRAARDASFTKLRTTFPASEIIKVDYTDTTYGIEVTQAFYTAHFQTRQALVWWSHCYSSLLNLVGAAEARVQVGYNGPVSVGKCLCDERTILQRMNGQEGIPKRPLKMAALNINGTCPDPKASLIIRGNDATTLSPAVLAEAPHGTVCSTTPGFIQFDTALDQSFDPAQAVVALSDAILTNHRWTADDRIDFVVVPTVPVPQIMYCAKQAMLMSEANRSRLDGNTDPAGVSGRGPNEDNFLWSTTCPPPSPPVRAGYPAAPRRETRPGRTTTVPVTVTNSGGTPVTVTSAGSDKRGWMNGAPGTVTVAPGGLGEVYHSLTVPAGVLPGTADTIQVQVTTPYGVLETGGTFAVASWFAPSWETPPVPAPGQPLTATVVLENASGIAVAVTGATLLVPGCPVAIWNGSANVQPDDSVEIVFDVAVPPGIPVGVPLAPDLTLTVGGLPWSHALPPLTVGLPLLALSTTAQDLAPGSPLATLVTRLSNVGDQPLELSYAAVDSAGWPVWVDGPPLVNPGETVPVLIHPELPADPDLVGRDGLVRLMVSGLGPLAGLEREFPLPYRPVPTLALLGDPARPLVFSGWTGAAVSRPLPLAFEVRNLSNQESGITATVACAGLPIEPPLHSLLLPPLGQASLVFTAPIVPDAPVGTYAAELQLHTPDLLGDQTVPILLEVTPPLTVAFDVKGAGGAPGDTVTLATRLANRRDDLPMAGELTWEQTGGWFDLPLPRFFEIDPGDSITVTSRCRLPFGRALADSDSVTVRLAMLYDTGTPATTTDGIWVRVGTNDLSDVVVPPPAATALARAAPNPFNPRTTIRYHLDRDAEVDLAVFDLEGRRLTTLRRGWTAAGEHVTAWTGATDAGRRAGSGVYLIRLRAGDQVHTKRVTLLK